MKKYCFQLHITICMVTNSSKLMNFVESMAAFQLLQRQKPQLVEVMWKKVMGELVLKMGLAEGMEIKPQYG